MSARDIFGLPTAASPDEQRLQEMSATAAQNQKYANSGPTTTTLDPATEQAFQAWVTQNDIPFMPQSKDPQDYDMRGFYQGLMAGDPVAQTATNANDGLMHFPDKWKTPYHHSFSAESQYANSSAPVWINDTQAADPKTGDVTWDERYMGRPAPVTRDWLGVARKR